MEGTGSRLGVVCAVVLLAVGGLGCNDSGASPKGGPAYVKASNTDVLDFFGSAIALSADGTTMAVGAFGESSSAIGVGGAQDDDSRTFAGAVYVYTRSGGRWAQQAYVKNPSYANAMDYFGNAVALSADGNTLAVGAWSESSVAGAVHVYTRSGATWTYRATLHAAVAGAEDHFGVSLAMSADGTMLAIGATGEASAASGVGGSQADDSAPWAGAVYVFTGGGATWAQRAYLKASNPTTYDSFGGSISLSADGSILAVGAVGEASATGGINPTPAQQADDSAEYTGAVYVFTRSGATWSQQAYLKASFNGRSDVFGSQVALDGGGTRLAVGAPMEDSGASGFDGDEDDDSAPASGAVYWFTHAASGWSQTHYVKPPASLGSEYFGDRLAWSADGTTLAVGADGEGSAATGIGGDETDRSASEAGAVFVY